MNRQLQVHDDDAHAEELALAHVAPSDIDVQIATAHRYPRSITDFQRDALTLATLDEDVASSMFYALPRADKTIEGPSARLAEVVASTWGNLRVESDIEAIDEKMITAVATCIDLQKNIAVDRKSTRLNSSHVANSYAVFCLKKKTTRATAATKTRVIAGSKRCQTSALHVRQDR